MKYQCKYCKKQFSKESTLSSHMCEQKRRIIQKDIVAVRIGYYTWIRFLDMQNGRTDVSYEHFAGTTLYTAFVRFGHHMEKLDPIYPDRYVDFLLRNSVKIDDWTKDYPYDTYIKELQIKEHPDKAIERSLKMIEKWSLEHHVELINCFENISTNLIVHWIQSGKLSPWILFCSSKSQKLLERMTPEQRNIINKYVDPQRWQIRVMKYETEVNTIKDVLNEIGI